MKKFIIYKDGSIPGPWEISIGHPMFKELKGQQLAINTANGWHNLSDQVIEDNHVFEARNWHHARMEHHHYRQLQEEKESLDTAE